MAESGLRTAMTERRCLRCLHWRFDDENPEAAEQEIQARFGPQVAVVGDCRHPENRMTTTKEQAPLITRIGDERPQRQPR